MVGKAKAFDRNVFLLLRKGWSWKFPWATTSVTPGFSHRKQREIGPKNFLTVPAHQLHIQCMWQLETLATFLITCN